MLDLDPRDHDSRDDGRPSHTPSRGGRGSSGEHDRDHDWKQPDARIRDRDDGCDRLALMRALNPRTSNYRWIGCRGRSEHRRMERLVPLLLRKSSPMRASSPV